MIDLQWIRMILSCFISKIRMMVCQFANLFTFQDPVRMSCFVLTAIKLMHIKFVYEKLRQKAFFADIEKSTRPPSSTDIKYKSRFPKMMRDVVYRQISDYVYGLKMVEHKTLLFKWYVLYFCGGNTFLSVNSGTRC